MIARKFNTKKKKKISLEWSLYNLFLTTSETVSVSIHCASVLSPPHNLHVPLVTVYQAVVKSVGQI